MRKARVRSSFLAFLCCTFALTSTGCAALAMGAMEGVAGGIGLGLDAISKRSGPTMDTTYQSDVPTVVGVVSRVVTGHTAQSQFVLTRNTTKDDPADREIQLHSTQGSRLTLRVQDASENGAAAARLRIWAHVELSIKFIGADRGDKGAADEFSAIIAKVRQETAKHKIKILRDTCAAESGYCS